MDRHLDSSRGGRLRRWRPVLACAAVSALVAGVPGSARAARPVVVELFTSQGCSSCPPADRFLAALARGRADILPLDFHVTYWNRLGWADPFSLEAATQRQDAYAALLHQDEVYTPEMVVDGRTGLVGSDRDAALSAIARALADAPPPVPVHVAFEPAGDVTVAVGPGAGAGAVVVVGYDPAHDTRVRAGENDGETLHEVDVVRSIADAGPWRGAAETLRVARPAGEEVAVLLQAPDGRILGVAAPR